MLAGEPKDFWCVVHQQFNKGSVDAPGTAQVLIQFLANPSRNGSMSLLCDALLPRPEVPWRNVNFKGVPLALVPGPLTLTEFFTIPCSSLTYSYDCILI